MCVFYHFLNTAKRYSVGTIFVQLVSLLLNVCKETLASNEISLLKLLIFFFLVRGIVYDMWKPENTYLCMRQLYSCQQSH